MTFDDGFVSELLHSWNIPLNVVQSLRADEIFSSSSCFCQLYCKWGCTNSRPTLSLRRDEEAVAYTRGRIFRGGFADLLSTVKWVRWTINPPRRIYCSACVCSQRSLPLWRGWPSVCIIICNMANGGRTVSAFHLPLNHISRVWFSFSLRACTPCTLGGMLYKCGTSFTKLSSLTAALVSVILMLLESILGAWNKLTKGIIEEKIMLIQAYLMMNECNFILLLK